MIVPIDGRRYTTAGYSQSYSSATDGITKLGRTGGLSEAPKRYQKQQKRPGNYFLIAGRFGAIIFSVFLAIYLITCV